MTFFASTFKLGQYKVFYKSYQRYFTIILPIRFRLIYQLITCPYSSAQQKNVSFSRIHHAGHIPNL